MIENKNGRLYFGYASEIYKYSTLLCVILSEKFAFLD